MDAKNGGLVTAGASYASAQQLKITDRAKCEPVQSGPITHYIEVVSGTFNFGVDEVDANAHGFGEGAKVIITCYPDRLYFKAASATDTFAVTI